jgi:D-tyrosyl-tRNA(Tyr) deacylase
MRLVIQRVRSASVALENRVVAHIGPGLLVLVGFSVDDDPPPLEKAAHRLINLRVFADAQGKMNHSVAEANGALLLVPQFTLTADVQKGNRPSFHTAAEPAKARAYFEAYSKAVQALYKRVELGVFQQHMLVALENEGPVTLVLDVRQACQI